MLNLLGLLNLLDFRGLQNFKGLQNIYTKKYKTIIQENEDLIAEKAEKAFRYLKSLESTKLLKYFPNTSKEDLIHFRTKVKSLADV